MLKLTGTLSQRKGRLELAQRTGDRCGQMEGRWNGMSVEGQGAETQVSNRGQADMCLEDEDWNNIENRIQLERCGCSQTRDPPYTLYWH